MDKDVPNRYWEGQAADQEAGLLDCGGILGLLGMWLPSLAPNNATVATHTNPKIRGESQARSILVFRPTRCTSNRAPVTKITTCTRIVSNTCTHVQYLSPSTSMASTTCTSMFKACTRPDRTSCSEGHMGGGQSDTRRCIFWSEWKQFGCSQCKIYGNFETFLWKYKGKVSSWEKILSCISSVLVWISHEISALTIRPSDRASEWQINDCQERERGVETPVVDDEGLWFSRWRMTSKNRNVDDDNDEVCIPDHVKNDNTA